MASYINSWQELGDKVINEYREKGYYRSNPIERELIDVDLRGATQEEMAKKAYYYVLDNFLVEGEDWIYPNQFIKNLLKTKVGSPGELVLALMAIYKSLGIECQPVLIGSKGYGRSQLVTFPFLNQFDEILLLAQIDGKRQFVDLSNPLAPFGYIDLDKQVAAGLLLEEGNSLLIPLEVSDQQSTSMNISQIEVDSLQGLVIKNTIRASKYKGLQWAELAKRAQEETGYFEKLFSTNHPNEVIQNISHEDHLVEKNYFTVNYDRIVPEFGKAETLIINPIQTSIFSESPFTSDFRVYPVDFGFLFKETFNTSILIPEGYEIDDYPIKESFVMEGGYLSFSYQPSIMNGKLSILSFVQVKNSMIPVSSYGSLKFFMEAVAAKLSSPVILKKTSQP